MYFFDMCSIDFWGHLETSTVGAVGSSTGPWVIMGAPTSPLGLSPKIDEEEEEEKRRSYGKNDIEGQRFRKAVKEGRLNKNH